jgi:methyl-accepting chemotaxis protein
VIAADVLIVPADAPLTSEALLDCFHESPLPQAVLTASLVVSEANHALAALFDRPVERLIGQSLADPALTGLVAEALRKGRAVGDIALTKGGGQPCTVSATAVRLTAGDRTGSIVYLGLVSRDPASSVSGRMQQLVDATQEAAGGIAQIGAEAESIASSSAQVSANAETSATGVEQIQKAMEDLTNAIEQITAAIETVSHQAGQASRAAEEGAELAGNVAQGNAAIEESVNRVHASLMDVERRMADISRVLTMIRDLATQTNLLALNAAIEAARAGEAGRGFAVVASEVKALALESKTGAEQIEEMIDALMRSSQAAAAAMVEARTLVGRGTAQSSEALGAFRRIEEAANGVARSASEVVAAAEEQAATTEEVAASIHEVGRIVGSTAEEAKAAARAVHEAEDRILHLSTVIERIHSLASETTTGR